MIIEKIHIINFGKLSDFTLELSEGINIIEGKNESGKSTVSAFIKFMFYGLPPTAEERAACISWHSATAAGTLTLNDSGTLYRIEREAVAVRSSDGKTTFRERCAIFNAETGKPLSKGKVPGEVFFCIPRGVFESTAFIGQLEGSHAGGRPLAEATENILFSADETVNTKKAIKKLDEARVHLYHKNRKGGKIYEYSRERAALAEKLTEAQETSAQIINLEGTKRTCAEAREKATQDMRVLDAEIAAYESYCIKQSYLCLREESEKSAQAEKELALLSASNRYGMAEDQFVRALEKEKFELIALETEKKNTHSACLTEEKKLAEIESTLRARKGYIPQAERDELAEAEEKARKNASTFKNLAFVCLALALCGAAGAFFLLPLAAAGAIFAAGMIACFILSASAKKRTLAVYEKFGAKTRKDYIAALSEIQSREVELTLTGKALCDAREKAEHAQRQHESKQEKLRSVLRRAQAQETEDIFADISAAEEAARSLHEKRKAAARAKAEAEARMKELIAHLDSFSEEEKERALSSEFDEQKMRRFDLRAKKRERDFLSGAIAAQTEKIHSVECELASLYAVHARPAEIAQAINALHGKIEALSEKFDACVLAIDAINTASGKLRDGISPKIAQGASEIMANLSGGKYDSLFVDSDFGMTYSAGGITRDIAALSAGTSDIAYISLRISLAKTLCPHTMPPFVFDESFTRLDDDRLKNVLALLENSFSRGAQAIIFTCHGREKTLAENTVNANSLSI